MSARDDAIHRDAPSRPPVTGRRLVRAAAAGMAAGLVLAALLVQHLPPGPWPRYEVRVAWDGGPPAASEWPRAPRPGEQVRCVHDGQRTLLVVHGPRAEETRALAAALQQARLSGLGAGVARRAAVRAEWRRGRLESEPWLARATRAAALVRGRLLLMALLDPAVPATAPPSSPAADRARARVEAASARVSRLALAVRPDSLASALAASAAAEGQWLRSVAAHPAIASYAQLEAVWRWHERARARELDGIERRLEAGLSESQAALVPALAFDRALWLERLAPDPAAVFFVSGRWQENVDPVPVTGTWMALLGAGALLGGLCGLALGLPRRRRREPGPAVVVTGLTAPRMGRDAEAAWRSELGWLHVVSGPDAERVAFGVRTLAGGFAGRGERVLAVDAGQDLRLHEHFGGEARWGLSDCLEGEVPLLGAVQGTGSAGVHLLSRGRCGVVGHWQDLSAVLEEAAEHFDRVILAVGVGTPRAAALPLGGRVLEAWWAEPGDRLPRRAVALAERLGIPFIHLNLDRAMQVEPEGVAPASAPLHDPPVAPMEAAAAAADNEVEPERAAGPVAGEPRLAELPVPEPVAIPEGPPPPLDWDPEVRDRLRFMLWMRRVQAERRSTLVEVGTGV